MTFDFNTEKGISIPANGCINMNYSEILNKYESTDMNNVYP